MFSFIIPSGLFECQSNKGRNAGARWGVQDRSRRIYRRHCEERSNEAIHLRGAMDCFAALAMTEKDLSNVIIREGG
jgi:hypothetical protein